MEINKILIKLPLLESEIFLVFPFLTIVSEEFPKAEICIIVEHGDTLAFQFLPFKVKVFERPREKQSLMETHQYVANLHEIFNIDLYFDLENSFNSAFIGFNFRAKHRVGFEMGWNKHLLTHSYKIEQFHKSKIELLSVKLLELYLNKYFHEVRIAQELHEKQKIEKIEKLFNEPEAPRFILIMLDNFSSVTREIEIWKNFFDSFEKQKFIVWSQNDENIISEIFAKIDLEKNELYMHRGSFPKELNYILGKVYGIITNNQWAEGLCGYYNLSFINFVSKNVPLPKYHYFKFHPMRILFNENIPTELVYRDEDKKFEKFNEVIDFVHVNFKL